MQQFPCVHGEGDVGFAGVGKHEAGVLIAALSPAKLFLPARIPCLHLGHLPFKFPHGVFAQIPDAGRDDITESLFQGHIALALHGKAGDAVAGQLCQQRPADAGDAEGEGSVLQHRQMPGGYDAPQEIRLILFTNQFPEFIVFQSGIAGASGQGAGLFRLGGVGQQRYLQARFGHGGSSSGCR